MSWVTGASKGRTRVRGVIHGVGEGTLALTTY